MPWAINRPYKGGDLYNCLVIDATMTETSDPHYDIGEVTVKDEECIISYCPVCRLDKKVRHINVRGLCSKSIFNSVYILTIGEDGGITYIGQYTSKIVYNKAKLQWEWFDQKDNTSLAVR